MHVDKYVTEIKILLASGEPIYTKTFTDKKRFDDELFSSFTSAILTFSREMGNELNSITLKDVNFYFRTIGPVIIILGVQAVFDDLEMVNKQFNNVLALETFDSILQNVSNPDLSIPIQFNSEVCKIVEQVHE